MIKACRSNGVASVVGAVTPTEIMNALDLGADVIKVFCAASVGPVFFENMLGPFPGICMMAAGGITLQNLKDYIRAGAEIVTYVPNLARSGGLRSRRWRAAYPHRRDVRGGGRRRQARKYRLVPRSAWERTVATLPPLRRKRREKVPTRAWEPERNRKVASWRRNTK